MNYPMNMKAVHNAFYSYQFITLSKMWVTIFVQLYPFASSKARDCFQYFGLMKKSEWTWSLQKVQDVLDSSGLFLRRKQTFTSKAQRYIVTICVRWSDFQ